MLGHLIAADLVGGMPNLFEEPLIEYSIFKAPLQSSLVSLPTFRFLILSRMTKASRTDGVSRAALWLLGFKLQT